MQSEPQFVERMKIVRRAVVWSTQISLFAFSGLAAFLLRFDLTMPPAHLSHLAFALTIWLLVKIIVFRMARLDRGLWRYVSIADISRLVISNVIASSVSCLLIVSLGPPGFPRSIYSLDFIICLLATSGLRLMVRMTMEATSNGRGKTSSDRPTLIYGAGGSGIALLKEIRKNPKLRYSVVGFLDDGAGKRGLQIEGVAVLGSGNDARVLVTEFGIETILVAIPSATGAEMTRILSLCHAAGAQCKTVPGLAEVLAGDGLPSQVRDVAVEDLLGRTPVQLEEQQIRKKIAGRVILVTGAAGSIGSELCRQIARFQPAGIVGFEISESPLFDIEREMKQLFPAIPFYPEIGNIQSRARVLEVLRLYKATAVYHAAAYKHVPLMEDNVFEAIENNVFGTYNLALAASECGVDDFVMISSDKAVRPTNVMGVSKRLAELVLLAMQNERTKFVAVRFGNVLGSNGSVIPIFKKQIAAGGPVTVTHPEMRRYFLTIPEATQLVLQASAIGRAGQICVLDMGLPIKILDLARNLILLSGLRPDVDIKIEISGVRPGEKLYEEISTVLEDTVPTDHGKVRIFVGDRMPECEVQEWLDDLADVCESRDVGRLIVTLKDIVRDYNPSGHLLKRALKPFGPKSVMLESKSHIRETGTVPRSAVGS